MLQLNLLLLLLGGILLAQPCTAEMRTWTSVSQHTVEAALATRKRGSVTLKKTDGEEVTIPISVLSRKDRDYLERAAVVPATAPNRLPLLAQTTWTMNLTPKQNRSPDRLSQEIEVYMIYEGETYTAAMGPTGRLYIQPDAIEEMPYHINAPMTIGWGHSYKKGEKYVSRELLEYLDPPVPQWNPESLELTARLEDESTISMLFEFTPTSFTVRSVLTDPSDTKTPTLFGWGFGIPPSHEFPREIPWEEYKTYLEKGKLRIKTPDGRETLDLAASQTLSRVIEWVEEENRWPGREVTVERLNERDTVTRMNMSNYPGMALYHGYALQSKTNTSEFQSGKANNRLNPATFKVTIE